MLLDVKRTLSGLVLTLAGITLLVGCMASPTGRSQFMLVSPESAIVQSRAAYLDTIQQLDANDQLLDDPQVADRVARITGQVVTAAINQFPHTRNWEWSVAIIDDDDTVNAWCMAGGRMAVYTGLFKQLNLTDAEFAQIMGHEISHALANHTAERMSRAMATTIGVMAVGVATDDAGAMGAAAVAAQLALELPNSRTAESEADQIGMTLATRAGFDPEAAVTLWQKMGSLSDERPPEFMSTHPAPDNRQAALNRMIPGMRQLNPTQRPLPVHPVEIVR